MTQLDSSDVRLAAAKEMVESQPDSLESQVRDCGGLNRKEASLELFHYWMREIDDSNISSGSIVDYRKYVAELTDSDGELTVEREELGSSHKRAAVSKYEDFLQTSTEDLEFSSTKSTEGDSE